MEELNKILGNYCANCLHNPCDCKLDLHSVSNCDYCDKETDKLIDENGFNYCEDCYMR